MRKWLFFSAFGLFLLLLPKIASLSPFKPFIARIIEKKTNAAIVLGSNHFSWFGPQDFRQVEWEKGEARGKIEEFSIQAPFWSFSGPFALKNGSIEYKGKQVELIHGKIEGENLELQGQHVLLRGSFKSGKQFDLSIDIEDFPIGVLDERLEPILGPSFTAKGAITQKVLDLAISTSYVQTRLLAKMQQGGIVLQEPLLAVIRITRALSHSLFHSSPILSTVESRTPALLKLETGSYLPFPLSSEKLKVKGAVDFGKIRCESDRYLAAMLALLKAKLPSIQTNMWFSPLEFEMKEGALQMGRVDFLIDDAIHLCAWGTVDLAREELHMKLGIPADTLFQSFGISGLSPDYVLTVNFEGSLEDPQIDKGPALATIAAFTAIHQIPKKSPLKDLAKTLAKPKMEKDIPPPKRPFPWEK